MERDPDCHNGGVKDIGTYANDMPAREDEPHPTMLIRDQSHELRLISDVIGSKQVTASKLDFVPPWILQEALRSEHESNWKDAYTEVSDESVPRSANVISSHVIYKVKTD